MICKSCAEPNADGAQFCAYCGEDLTGKEPLRPPVPPKTSGHAIASFVLALVGLVTCFLAPLTLLPALILGIVALVKIGRSEGRLGGSGFAIAGVCVSGVSVFFVIPIIAAIAIPNLMASRIASNESCAVAGLRAYLSAQSQFRRSDRYGKNKRVYANPKDGRGFPDLYEVGGEQLRLIDGMLAEATSRERAKAGYYFADIEYDDYATECGLCAVPAQYNRSGRNIFIIDVTGTVYQRDAADVHPGLKSGDPAPPLTAYPGPKEITEWIPVGSM